MNDLNRETGLAALQWYVDAGVDEATGCVPVNRFIPVVKQPVAEAEKKPRPTTSLQRPLSTTTATPQGAQAVESARDIAARCQTLGDLKTAIEGFEGCGLQTTAHSTVFADGDPNSGLMLIGEAPGREEDREGRPFIGRSGQLLDRMFGAIGRDRTQPDDAGFYITNVVPWRPPGNRNPTPEEIAICQPFIERHIELVAPKVIVALGGVSAKYLLDTSTGIMKLRGKWGTYVCGDFAIPILPLFHPAYLLRQPAQKRYAWNDLQMLDQKLKNLNA